ncbi:MAG TPA: hypothetical protein VMD08_16080 [Candidatus Baltobacteraceae bacterium]|nr:hypothetical protein [Candidatus Baltobacteraceae bacterium]
MSSVAIGAGSVAAAAGADVGAVVAGRAVVGVGVSAVRARHQAVTPWRVSTAKPRGNASARACRAA